ncbi:uncharacterized protein LOC123315408 isoform X2 [Coccinella septempunctata]|nr:uncharacterized protein LOC123315408 isoform X2 [Coccinella septempunctata]XP_044757023.1 uncharacterized protein LOC123315408 isoform X2 [Coccinella septempunctata]
MPSLGMGRIFTIGSTAAMAWILPHEPTIFLDKKNKNNRPEMDSKIPDHLESLQSIYQEEDNGNNDEDYNPYYNSHDIGEMGKEVKKYYNFQGYDSMRRPDRIYFPNHNYKRFREQPVESEHWHIYRRSRRSLYEKLEKFLNALNKDGQACILKMICEVSQIADRKGNFMEEIIKVIFRIKTHNTANEDIYDAAANESHNCKKRYESCQESFFGLHE